MTVGDLSDMLVRRCRTGAHGGRPTGSMLLVTVPSFSRTLPLLPLLLLASISPHPVPVTFVCISYTDSLAPLEPSL